MKIVKHRRSKQRRLLRRVRILSDEAERRRGRFENGRPWVRLEFPLDSTLMRTSFAYHGYCPECGQDTGRDWWCDNCGYHARQDVEPILLGDISIMRMPKETEVSIFDGMTTRKLELSKKDTGGFKFNEDAKSWQVWCQKVLFWLLTFLDCKYKYEYAEAKHYRIQNPDFLHQLFEIRKDLIRQFEDTEIDAALIGGDLMDRLVENWRRDDINFSIGFDAYVSDWYDNGSRTVMYRGVRFLALPWMDGCIFFRSKDFSGTRNAHVEQMNRMSNHRRRSPSPFVFEDEDISSPPPTSSNPFVMQDPPDRQNTEDKLLKELKRMRKIRDGEKNEGPGDE